VALQSWLDHTRRNQSVITDLMTGQYKSKVTCPSCDKQCITFDPFITVTLPIPQKVVNTFTCFVIFTNFEKETKRVAFSYSKPNVEEWT
jgi:ubiquitin carboxyl-terminal hydrolase 4/11/15